MDVQVEAVLAPFKLADGAQGERLVALLAILGRLQGALPAVRRRGPLEPELAGRGPRVGNALVAVDVSAVPGLTADAGHLAARGVHEGDAVLRVVLAKEESGAEVEDDGADEEVDQEVEAVVLKMEEEGHLCSAQLR